MLTLFVLAFAMTLLLTPIMIWVAGVLRVVDAPGGRRVHSSPTPRGGGIPVAIGASLAIAFVWIMPSGVIRTQLNASQILYLGLALGAGLLLAVGFVDDMVGIRPLAKLIAQVVAATIAYNAGFRIEVLPTILQSTVAFNGVSWALTVLWIVAVTNAFNLVDGLDGLATGIALVTLSATALTAMLTGNAAVLLISMALMGSLVAFLGFNFFPARIFLGDSGSMFLGFLLAVLSVHGSTKRSTAVLLLVPLFSLAVPLFDTFITIVRRWLRGSPLFSADARHIHHRMVAVGIRQRNVVLLLYMVAVIFAAAGMLVAFSPPEMIAVTTSVAVVVLVLISGVGLARLDYYEFTAAGSLFIGGPRRLRRLIQDRILAAELVEELHRARDLNTVQELLRTFAGRFSFLHMELCQESDPGRSRIASEHGGSHLAWKLDHPISNYGDDPMVVRIWCDPNGSSRPYGAERVIRILGPELRDWVTAHGTEITRYVDIRAARRIAHAN